MVLDRGQALPVGVLLLAHRRDFFSGSYYLRADFLLCEEPCRGGDEFADATKTVYDVHAVDVLSVGIHVNMGWWACVAYPQTPSPF